VVRVAADHDNKLIIIEPDIHVRVVEDKQLARLACSKHILATLDLETGLNWLFDLKLDFVWEQIC
jgi:hypothetical protein